ncbi:hypothetical protein BASA83_012935 [Batrachochytrium salamandrivorans]|nr:hypothetical protein BASA83_012935 [Batrachochytrium salamandrivorans]
MNTKFQNSTLPPHSLLCLVSSSIRFATTRQMQTCHTGRNALKEKMVEMSFVLFLAIGNLSKRSVNKARLAFIKKFGKQISKDPFPVDSSVMIVDPVRSSKNEPYYLGPFKVLRRTKGGS